MTTLELAFKQHVNTAAKNRMRIAMDYVDRLSAQMKINEERSKQYTCKRGHIFNDKNTRYEQRSDHIARCCRVCEAERKRKKRNND